MGSIRTRSDNGLLFFDFRFKNQRCREQTLLEDTKSNRKKMEALLQRIEEEISNGTFEYLKYFPNSKTGKKLDSNQPKNTDNDLINTINNHTNGNTTTPLFKDFCEKWFNESNIDWRRSYIITVRGSLDKHLIPYFGDKMVSSIRREDVLDFRSKLAKAPGRKGHSLSARRINAVILNLSQVMNEAADRFHFTTPTQRINPLKIKRVDIAPFTMEEVNLIIKQVRADYRDYFIVRFFTGMRTGEIHGLKWKYIDFSKRQILIRETLVWGEMEDEGKTQLSNREITMSDIVYESLLRQREVTHPHSEFVFCNSQAHPLNLNNVTNRVWYPLLRYLNLDLRRPYMTRHTAATLWLAAGENPEWIARQLGHVSTEMLFKVYSRFVPNLTRHDGSAFNRLLTGSFDLTNHSSTNPQSQNLETPDAQ
ncbi:MAG: site-specific integrase [Methylotenera sp.]|nr:MAG: site-specific integrase [Methylotenera sp.]